jgi:hypothetical protein
MNAVIMSALKILGWQKLLKMVWSAVQPELKKAAAKTETAFDDGLVSIMDELIGVVVEDKNV